jgi:hypothetical protein
MLTQDFIGKKEAVNTTTSNDLTKRFYTVSPTLTAAIIVMAGIGIGAIIGLAFDSRQVLNSPTWAKSVKFTFSLIAYMITLLWILSYMPNRPRLVKFVGAITGIVFILEMIVLTVQAFRAQPSHFNSSSSFDSTLFGVMGASITVFWLVNLIGAIFLLFRRFDNKVLGWGIKLGVIVALIGLALGYLMTFSDKVSNVPAESGTQVWRLVGSHTIGAVDGDPGILIFGWSATHGDLRIPHFFGIHGLQIIPLLGWFISKRREQWLHTGHRIALVFVGALGYLSLVALVTWQALRGQSIIAPDALTLGTFGAISAVVGLAVGAILFHARRARALN